MRSSDQTESSRELHLICLHGFLGLHTDWDLIAPLVTDSWRVHHVNVWSQISDLKTWSQNFCKEMRELEGTKVLLGYSMGGRLAMHALAEDRDLFNGAVLVSTNPGLKTEEEKRVRLAADQVWADKFRKLEWNELLTQWNSQNVFNEPANLAKDSITLARNESDFDREILAESMELWSLGFQRDFEPVLKELEIPILYVTGRSDTKFTTLTANLVSHPAWGDRPHVIVEKAGHRVPWDSPQDFRSILAKFLGRWYR